MLDGSGSYTKPTVRVLLRLPATLPPINSPSVAQPSALMTGGWVSTVTEKIQSNLGNAFWGGSLVPWATENSLQLKEKTVALIESDMLRISVSKSLTAVSGTGNIGAPLRLYTDITSEISSGFLIGDSNARYGLGMNACGFYVSTENSLGYATLGQTAGLDFVNQKVYESVEYTVPLNEYSEVSYALHIEMDPWFAAGILIAVFAPWTIPFAWPAAAKLAFS